MVFYRKYRPQTIEQLDSEAVKKVLTAVLSSDELPHAFLFTGPKGLGKTSTARIVAKYVNCEKGLESKTSDQGSKTKGQKQKITIPCNTCSSCTSITDGTNLDVLEIDGASNRGIDEMRDLREKIRLLPVAAAKKVYIIDEVHMLTQEAFNALLKTIEEPPAHALFILCTTEPHKVPATIVSRCFHIQFKKATTQDLVQSFERIVQGERIQADIKALELIATFSDGSFRDGAKILEEVVLGLDGNKLTKDVVDATYHTKNIDQYVHGFFDSLFQNKTKNGLDIIERIVQEGVDIKYFTQQLLFALHKMLLENVEISNGEKHTNLDIATIQRLAEGITKAHSEIRGAVLPQLPLELLIVEWTQGQNKKEEKGGDEEAGRIEQKRNNEEKQLNKDQSIASKQIQTVFRDDKTLLHQILDSIKGEHNMLAGILRSCKILNQDNSMTIEAPSLFHKQRLEEKKALDVLEKVCENITGKSATITIVLRA